MMRPVGINGTRAEWEWGVLPLETIFRSIPINLGETPFLNIKIRLHFLVRKREIAGRLLGRSRRGVSFTCPSFTAQPIELKVNEQTEALSL